MKSSVCGKSDLDLIQFQITKVINYLIIRDLSTYMSSESFNLW